MTTRPTGSAVALAGVDETVLAALLQVATADAEADEVTPPLGDGSGWNPERRAWFEAYHRRCRQGLEGPAGEATWAVTMESSPVGAVRLQRTDDRAVLVAGVWLRRAVRGQGVGVEALRLVLQQAATAGASTVRADTALANRAAQAAMLRTGFALAAPDADGRVHAVATASA